MCPHHEQLSVPALNIYWYVTCYTLIFLFSCNISPLIFTSDNSLNLIFIVYNKMIIEDRATSKLSFIGFIVHLCFWSLIRIVENSRKSTEWTTYHFVFKRRKYIMACVPQESSMDDVSINKRKEMNYLSTASDERSEGRSKVTTRCRPSDITARRH
jgi:hypothetical protein